MRPDATVDNDADDDADDDAMSGDVTSACGEADSEDEDEDIVGATSDNSAAVDTAANSLLWVYASVEAIAEACSPPPFFPPSSSSRAADEEEELCLPLALRSSRLYIRKSAW